MIGLSPISMGMQCTAGLADTAMAIDGCTQDRDKLLDKAFALGPNTSEENMFNLYLQEKNVDMSQASLETLQKMHASFEDALKKKKKPEDNRFTPRYA